MIKRYLTSALIAVMYFTLTSTAAHAGFLDALNAAAKKLNENTQPMQNQPMQTNTPQQTEDADHPLNLEDHDKTGSCEGKRSATCMDYMELMDHCMAPVHGYRMKVLGDRIEQKLKTETLTDKQRKNLQEDLAGAREAEKNKSDDPTIAGEKKSQRYLMDISDEDQVYVNAEYGRFSNRIMNKCEGADHMQTGHRTEFMTDFGPTGDEAVARYRKEHTRKTESHNCLKDVAGVRYKIMADMMGKKMQTLKLSDKERAEWEADIAAVRKTAESGGTTMPQVNDPVNPYRPITRLTTPDEQMQLNNEFTKQSQVLIAQCSGSSGGAAPRTNRHTHSGYTPQ